MAGGGHRSGLGQMWQMTTGMVSGILLLVPLPLSFGYDCPGQTYKALHVSTKRRVGWLVGADLQGLSAAEQHRNVHPRQE